MRDERKPSKALIRKLMGSILPGQDLYRLAQKQMVISGYPLIPQNVKLLDKYLSEDDVVECIRLAYSKYFNMDDILDLLSFFKTEAGKKFLACQSNLAKDILLFTQEAAQKAAAKLVKDIMEGRVSDPS